MEATTLNPFFASSIAVSRPMPLDEPVTMAILSGMALKRWNLLYHEVRPAKDIDITDYSQKLSLGALEDPMRTMTNVRTRRSNYFHSHPLHGTFALIASLALTGLVAMVITWSAR